MNNPINKRSIRAVAERLAEVLTKDESDALYRDHVNLVADIAERAATGEVRFSVIRRNGEVTLKIHE